jgi:hypothetical protein
MYYSGYCSNQGDFDIRTFVYSNIPTFVFSLAALTYKSFCASRQINVTSNRSATECAQSASGTCLFVYFFFIHDIVTRIQLEDGKFSIILDVLRATRLV